MAELAEELMLKAGSWKVLVDFNQNDPRRIRLRRGSPRGWQRILRSEPMSTSKETRTWLAEKHLLQKNAAVPGQVPIELQAYQADPSAFYARLPGKRSIYKNICCFPTDFLEQ